MLSEWLQPRAPTGFSRKEVQSSVLFQDTTTLTLTLISTAYLSGSLPLVSHFPKSCYSTLFDATAFALCLIQIHDLISLCIKLLSMDYHYTPSLVYILNSLFLHHPPSKNPTLDKPSSDCLDALSVQLDTAGEKDTPMQAGLTLNSGLKTIIGLYTAQQALPLPLSTHFSLSQMTTSFFVLFSNYLHCLTIFTLSRGPCFPFQLEKNFHRPSLHIHSF